MSKLLMKSLKADLPALAELIRSQGRGKDTVLAHITPQEAALLKKRGGSGTINPDTGLPEFQEDYGFDYGGGDYGGGDYSGGDYNYDVEAQPGGFYGGEAPTPEQFAQVYPDYTPDMFPAATTMAAAPAPEVSAPIYDVEAQPGGFYGGAAPTPTEFARTLPAGTPPAELAAAGVRPSVVTPTGEEKSIFEKLGLSTKDLTRLGLGATIAGGLTAANIGRTRQAGQQAQAATQEQKAIAQPYQQAGTQLTTAAQRGELSPANLQALQAAQAQMAQGVATRGGVGAAQMQTQLAALRSLMLENQFNFGLKVAQIGDNYALGAIKSGLQADRALGTANQQFYGQLAQLLAPFITGVPTRA